MRGWAADLLADPRTLVWFTGLALLALLGTWPLARRTGAPVWMVAGTLLAAAVVGTLTLSPEPGHPVLGPSPAAAGDCLGTLADPGAWLRALVATHSRGERVGNVLMFIPVCGLAVLVTHRPVRVLVAGVLAPVTLEVTQALLGAGRNCAADDWVNNATGAVLGVAAGALVLAVSARSGRLPHPPVRS